MPLIHRPTTLDWPERWRKMFDFDWESSGWMRVEEVRDGDVVVVRAELPGVDPDKDVDISVKDGVLHIEAKREEKSEEASKHGYHSEFRYGMFAREFALPSGASLDDVTATYKDGILEVRVPVPSSARPAVTKVPIVHG